MEGGGGGVVPVCLRIADRGTSVLTHSSTYAPGFTMHKKFARSDL